MKYGVITACEITGKPGISATTGEAFIYNDRLTLAEAGYIRIGDRSDADYKCEIDVSEENVLTLSFRDASDQLLGSVRITDQKLYKAMNLYHERIEEFHSVRCPESASEFERSDYDSKFDAADEARSIAHGAGTAQLIGILEHQLQNEGKIVPVEFEGDFRAKPIRALFFLCTHAIHAQPEMR
jgi:hypothetical protein